MATDPIATIDDLRARVQIPITSLEDVTRAEALLSDASSMVRSVTGRPFGSFDVTVRLSAFDGLVKIAARDISAVASVTTVTGQDLGARWDGHHTIAVGMLNQFDVDESLSPDVVEVTYTRTGPLAPDWVVAMVCQMAARAFGRPPEQSGVSQESIAGYSYSVGSAAAAGGIGLLPYEEAQLRRAFPKGGSSARVWLR